MKIPTAIAGALQGLATRSFLLRRLRRLRQPQDRLLALEHARRQPRHAHPVQKPSSIPAIPISTSSPTPSAGRPWSTGCQPGRHRQAHRHRAAQRETRHPSRQPRVARRQSRRRHDARRSPPSLSIGQGDTMATPLQLCAVVASVANGGKYYQPRIVRKAVAQDGTVVIEDNPKLVVDLTRGRHQAQRPRTHPQGHVDVRQRTRRHRRQSPHARHRGRRQNRHRPDHRQRQEIQQLMDHQFRALREPEIRRLRPGPERRLRRRRLRPARQPDLQRPLRPGRRACKLPLKPQTEYAGNTRRDIEPPDRHFAETTSSPPINATETPRTSAKPATKSATSLPNPSRSPPTTRSPPLPLSPRKSTPKAPSFPKPCPSPNPESTPTPNSPIPTPHHDPTHQKTSRHRQARSHRTATPSSSTSRNSNAASPCSRTACLRNTPSSAKATRTSSAASSRAASRTSSPASRRCSWTSASTRTPSSTSGTPSPPRSTPASRKSSARANQEAAEEDHLQGHSRDLSDRLGDRHPGFQGAHRHQGPARHHQHLAGRPLSRPHALHRAVRHFPQDRRSQGARPPAQDRPEALGPGRHGHHHAHRRPGHPRPPFRPRPRHAARTMGRDRGPPRQQPRARPASSRNPA